MKSIHRGLAIATLLASTALPGTLLAQEGNVERTPAVFVMTNNAEKNQVLGFQRDANGSLFGLREFATGGRGSGGVTDPLESQGSLTLSQDKSLLFAANAGSGEISVFAVHGDHLFLLDKIVSEGSEPNAIAQHGNLVYVLNTGGSSNVVGFRLLNGKLKLIKNSTRFLSTNTSGASSIAISPDGRFLVVVERLTNNIDVFGINGDGTLSTISVNASAGPGAFAASFGRNGVLLVSETGAGGVPNGSAVSSYAIAPNGKLSPITTSLPTLGAANCWNAVTPDGRFIYTSNAGTSTIAGFAVANNGTLTALPGTLVGINLAGATNLDIAVSGDGKFLYSLNDGAGTVGIFAIQNDGTLLSAGSAAGLRIHAGFNGIAAE